MRGMKRLLCLALATGTLATAMSIQLLAISDYKYITSISLKVDIDLDSGDKISDGDSLGTDPSDSGDKVYTSLNKCRVQSAEWSNDKEVTIGDMPKITAWLEPESSSNSNYDYRFCSSHGSNSVSASGGTFVSVSKSGSDLKMVIRTNGIRGTYDPPENTERGSTRGKARWGEPENGGSGYYDVYLHRGLSVVRKLEEHKGISHNFYSYVTEEGDYSFKVRTVPHTEEKKERGKKNEWIETGDLYIVENEVSDGDGQENGNGSTSSGRDTDVEWCKEGDTWYFKHPDGNYQKNGWLRWNDKWYLFSETSKMITGWKQTNSGWYYLGENGDTKTGWVKSSNIWYYMDPNQDGPEGAMVENSWPTTDGKTYFMNESSAMVEGRYKVQDNWYYSYLEQGRKVVSTSISGFQLDANGVWQH